jgi:hypothetical protein
VTELVFAQEQLDAILGTAARILLIKENWRSASILANAAHELKHWAHDNWNGGQDTWMLFLQIPVETYLELDNRDQIERWIAEALNTAAEAVAGANDFEVKITTLISADPDWRIKTKQLLDGEGITNQGRVRSDNIAPIQQDGLLFRSRPEVEFYLAMKRTGIPFAPLPVVLMGGYNYKRIEPDFVLFYKGLVAVVEIDGDKFHTERPVDSHSRIKMLLDEGAIEIRVSASACDTSQKAKEAVENMIQSIDKRKQAR